MKELSGIEGQGISEKGLSKKGPGTTMMVNIKKVSLRLSSIY
jgi:hypothetical protein